MILTRCVGEAVVIGDDICITAVGIKGGQVSPGIKAPDDVHVLRDELLDTTPTENRPLTSSQGR